MNLPLIRPAALRPGGHIAVLAASSPSTPDRIECARARIESRGYRVTLADNLYDRYRTFLAGPDERRLAEIGRMFADASIDAFFFARGGYGAMRLLENIDWQLIRRNPRPVVGFSDVTAIHQALAVAAGVSSFHGPMLNADFHDGMSPDREQWFWDLLSGAAPMRWSIPPDQFLIEGAAEGPLFGGCLSLTVALMATPYDFWIDDGIWFWEDVSEPLYRIDRMLTHLRLSGRLRRIRGIMIGTLKDCGDEGTDDLRTLLIDRLGDLGIPVAWNLPFGHDGNNLLLPIGAPARLTAGGELVLPEPVVER